MHRLKQAILMLWDSITNCTHLTDAEQQMITHLRALDTTDDERTALATLAAAGATPELIRTFTKMTATGRITDQTVYTLMAHGITERITP